MNDWWSCKNDPDFHCLSNGIALCGKPVEPDEHMGAAYMGLRCENCKVVVASLGRHQKANAA